MPVQTASHPRDGCSGYVRDLAPWLSDPAPNYLSREPNYTQTRAQAKQCSVIDGSANVLGVPGNLGGEGILKGSSVDSTSKCPGPDGLLFRIKPRAPTLRLAANEDLQSCH